MKKELIPAIIGILLPAFFILAVAGYIFFYQKLADPKYDFLFAGNQSSNYENCTVYLNYLVVSPEGKITSIQNKDAEVQKNTMTGSKEQYAPCRSVPIIEKKHQDIYRYNFKTQSIQDIQDEDLLKYKLALAVSPDGYAVGYSYDQGRGLIGDIFTPGNSQGFYLKKDGKQKRLVSSSRQELLETGWGTTAFGWIVSE